jgi:DNA-binding transcriptional LysR family regulator
MVLIVSPANPLSAYEYLERKMLSDAQYIAHDESSQLYKMMEKIITKLKLPFNVAMTLGSVDAINHAVAANIGVSFVPYTSAMEDIQLGLLKKVNLENRVWKYPYSLVYNQKKQFLHLL